MINAASWRGKCLVCGEDFAYEDGFSCKKVPGNHRLETKAYYHFGGNQLPEGKDRRSWAPMVVLDAPADRRDPDTGRAMAQQPIIAQFAPGGVFQTADALEQYLLETRTSCGWGAAGKARWEEIYLTTDQKRAMAESRLRETQRKVLETNAMLEELKQRAEAERRKEPKSR